MKHPKTNRARGFIRGRLFLSLLATGIGIVALYYGAQYGREFYKVKMCETCTERMWLIEGAKRKYQERYGAGAQPSRYSELLAFLPFTGFPMCPWGGKYKYELDTSRPVECSLNGDPEYEPKTPGKNLMRNGYMDLAVKQKSVSLVDFLTKRAGKSTPEKKKAKESAKDSGLFD